MAQRVSSEYLAAPASNGAYPHYASLQFSRQESGGTERVEECSRHCWGRRASVVVARLGQRARRDRSVPDGHEAVLRLKREH